MLIDGGINKVQPALSDHSASYFNNSELALVNQEKKTKYYDQEEVSLKDIDKPETALGNYADFEVDQTLNNEVGLNKF